MMELPFTIDEYFEFFKYRLAPIIEALLDGRQVRKKKCHMGLAKGHGLAIIGYETTKRDQNQCMCQQ